MSDGTEESIQLTQEEVQAKQREPIGEIMIGLQEPHQGSQARSSTGTSDEVGLLPTVSEGNEIFITENLLGKGRHHAVYEGTIDGRKCAFRLIQDPAFTDSSQNEIMANKYLSQKIDELNAFLEQQQEPVRLVKPPTPLALALDAKGSYVGAVLELYETRGEALYPQIMYNNGDADRYALALVRWEDILACETNEDLLRLVKTYHAQDVKRQEDLAIQIKTMQPAQEDHAADYAKRTEALEVEQGELKKKVSNPETEAIEREIIQQRRLAEELNHYITEFDYRKLKTSLSSEDFQVAHSRYREARNAWSRIANLQTQVMQVQQKYAEMSPEYQDNLKRMKALQAEYTHASKGYASLFSEARQLGESVRLSTELETIITQGKIEKPQDLLTTGTHNNMMAYKESYRRMKEGMRLLNIANKLEEYGIGIDMMEGMGNIKGWYEDTENGRILNVRFDDVSIGQKILHDSGITLTDLKTVTIVQHTS